MSSTKGAIPFHIETQGGYSIDPRDRVGVGRYYINKETIPLTLRYEGMRTMDDNGTLWILKGGKTNADYLDIFSLYLELTKANVANGYAALDATGKLSNAVIPALAIGQTYVRSTEAQMLTLAAQEGDICKRTDQGKTYVLQGADPTVLANWIDISSNFAGGIESVNGKTETHVTLNLSDIPDTAQHVKVTPAEKLTWDSKQDPLNYDAVPTFQSNNIINSGALFDYLKTIQSSVETTSWTGNLADANNRFYLAPEDKDLDQVIIFTEGGITQHEGVHFTIDANKRYIQFSEDPDDTKTYYLKWLSNIPVVSLTSVGVANVEGLLEGGKVKEELLPEGVGGAVEKGFDSILVFDKDYYMEDLVSGPIAFTLDSTGAKKPKKNIVYLRADGLNKPTFSNDFIIYSDNYLNTAAKWNRIYFEYTPSGKVLVDITYL